MENARGILLLIASMAAFAVEDAFVKTASAMLGPGQIMATLGVGGALVFALACRLRGRPVLTRDILDPAVLLRNGGEMVGTLGYITALTLIPLSLATAILQAGPLMVTAGAALFLGEIVGWRRWMAVVIGLAGVLVILRPGLDGFDPLALWAVLGVTGLAMRDLATRRVPRRVDAMQLSAWAFAGLVPVGLAVMAVNGTASMPDGPAVLALFVALVFGCIGYATLTASMRMGDIAVIIPFRYTRLVFALVIGIAVFGERPDLLTLLGAAIVVLTGLYAFVRERQLSRRAAARLSPGPAPR
ncbi:hypothetical protein OCGS_1684 [Oceaniovalibus guishaninsula JLT2003]|uniref:EamA domain-containing protein n=1 Tax=Oceaniovalibus guishaninsula JLT2003 TaxID=1231392 RepID=K2H9F8_9RHOB|nr:DMT family transporter [Oceaniovalibus guishaninsula]EKE44168.1 hypothetical protein OCGS_1684 [Oceaniovalibus guishaninsula JLT2003]